MCLCVRIFVCQSSRQTMSQVPRCAGISLADTLTGRSLALDLTGNVKPKQHMLIFSCSVILNSVLFHFDLFSLCFLYPLPRGPPPPPPFIHPPFPPLLSAPRLSFLWWWWFMSVSWCTNTLHSSPKQFSTNGNLQYCMLKPSGCCWWPVVGDWYIWEVVSWSRGKSLLWCK